MSFPTSALQTCVAPSKLLSPHLLIDISYLKLGGGALVDISLIACIQIHLGKVMHISKRGKMCSGEGERASEKPQDPPSPF